MGGWSGRKVQCRGLAGGGVKWADRAREVTITRVQWEGETQTLREGFEQRYKIKSIEKGRLGRMEFQITCHCDGRNC
jgi:hypothetical protein